jgi:hypothetical protein
VLKPNLRFWGKPGAVPANIEAAEGFETIGDVTSGLIPALLSSIAPRGMPPPDTLPGAPPPKDDVDDVPDTVPADVPGPHDPDKPIGPELSP